MKKTIAPLIPERLNEIRQEQYAELGSGGADLIKLDPDLLCEVEEDFNTILTFKTTYTFGDGTQKEITFPLFENKDAIIYENNEDVITLHYANRETQEIRRIWRGYFSEDHTRVTFDDTDNASEFIYSKNERKALLDFILSLEDMEDNSSRRSSDEEHQLIKRLLHRELHREGIRYQQDAIDYRDNCTSFRLINAYRTYLRLYEDYKQFSLKQEYDQLRGNEIEEGLDKKNKKIVKNSWIKGVGKAQGEVMWLLQCLCEKDRPSGPLPVYFDNFTVKRYYEYDNDEDKIHIFLEDGKLDVGLGSVFAICKGGDREDPFKDPFILSTAPDESDKDEIVLDMIALCRLVESAKAEVIECEQDQDLQSQSSFNAQ